MKMRESIKDTCRRFRKNQTEAEKAFGALSEIEESESIKFFGNIPFVTNGESIIVILLPISIVTKQSLLLKLMVESMKPKRNMMKCASKSSNFLDLE